MQRSPISLDRPTSSAPVIVKSTGKQSDSGQFVNLSRIETDPEYRKRIRKHANIRAYLASPSRGQPEFEQVIDWAIGNGYGINDVPVLWSSLNLAQRYQTAEEIRAEFEKKGVAPEKLQKNTEQAMANARQLEVVSVLSALQLGSEDMNVVESFFELVPLRRRSETQNIMPRVPPIEGEAILTDEDWMSDERKTLAANYKGLPRSTDRRPDWRPPAPPASSNIIIFSDN